MITREEIKNRMLSMIKDEYDKSEGSFFYDVINTLAIELEDAYKDQNTILDKGFVETSEDEYLDRKALEKGVHRKPPTKATTTVIIQGSEGVNIDKGMLVASDNVNFIVQERKTIDSTGAISVLVECEKDGVLGNVPKGAIKYFPITISGLSSVTNPVAVTNGYDGETDDELRKRYYEKVRTPATSGNKYHYRNWALEIPGVGDVRVIPLWNGRGSVKIIIIDTDKTGAEQELVDKVHSHIEENRPIGATITTVSATEVPIDIEAFLTIDTDNYEIEQVKSNIEKNVSGYLKEIAFIGNYVSHAKLGSIVLDSEGVLDYRGLIVNEKNSSDEEPNIKIEHEEVAVLGVITIV
ncbi:baseplate J/gp47 family protein [Wukongibacter baidiensis]|uniref:baseplate J/gp47 family protein n=1 Tax=Wukongibacter baidiensis TaxID=1723361 RepID=UPI003D7FA5D9